MPVDLLQQTYSPLRTPHVRHNLYDQQRADAAREAAREAAAQRAKQAKRAKAQRAKQATAARQAQTPKPAPGRWQRPTWKRSALPAAISIAGLVGVAIGAAVFLPLLIFAAPLLVVGIAALIHSCRTPPPEQNP